MAESKEIRYLEKDFSQFRQNLISFAKTYFPDTYNDFNESDPGMMFIEMAAYVGDVLSFYMDSQLKETLVQFAEEKQNIIALAYGLGYKPKNVVAATTTLDFFQIVPSKGTGAATGADMDYGLTIPANTQIASKENTDIVFRTMEVLDFKASSSFNPTEVTVYEIDSTTNEPTFYLLKKSVKSTSGTVKTATYNFGEAKQYDRIILPDTDVIDVVDIYDTDDNRWYEVQYLAQEGMFEEITNIAANDPDLYQYNDTVPYLLKVRKTPLRFITRFNTTDNMEIQFGAGINAGADEEIVPNPDNVGLALPYGLGGETSIDPANFLYTRAYGVAPSNTTLTVRYTTGDGLSANVGANSLTDIISIQFDTDTAGLSGTILDQVHGSVACTNPFSATGGRTSDSVDEIRNNALAYFAAQNRAVTKEDYIVRTYSLPAKFGSIAKAYITKDSQVNAQDITQSPIANPLALNLYTLSYNAVGQLTFLNDALRENLKTYLAQYRMLTDAINIKDGFIINIGIEFEIINRPNYNNNEVLLRCVGSLQNYFDIKKWQINQPITVTSLYTLLDKIEGVQTVSNVQVVNFYDSTKGYSGNIYNIPAATLNGIIYPSLDPSIFEVKYPNSDIKGKVVTL